MRPNGPLLNKGRRTPPIPVSTSLGISNDWNLSLVDILSYTERYNQFIYWKWLTQRSGLRTLYCAKHRTSCISLCAALKLNIVSHLYISFSCFLYMIFRVAANIYFMLCTSFILVFWCICRKL